MSDKPTESRDVTLRAPKPAGKGINDKLTPDERKAFYDQSSPRAVAIILATIVENHLTALLRLLMRRGSAADKRIADELFRQTGPLGPFATKIRVAYMLRIIHGTTYNDLLVISRIRNRFAHDVSLKSFDDQPIREWIKNMHMYSIVCKMSEEGKEQLKNRKGDNEPGLAAALIKSHATLSLYDTYRECLRFIIHHIVDYEHAVIEEEAKLNAKQSGQGPSPGKS